MRIYADGLETVRGFFLFQQPSVDPGSPWTPLATSVALHPYGHAASFRSERLFRSFGVIGLRPALEVSVTRDITYVCFTTLVDALKIPALTWTGAGAFMFLLGKFVPPQCKGGQTLLCRVIRAHYLMQEPH